jgi:hypothetical protein
VFAGTSQYTTVPDTYGVTVVDVPKLNDGPVAVVPDAMMVDVAGDEEIYPFGFNIE